MKTLGTLALLVLSGCGISEANFGDKFQDAYCAADAACETPLFADEAACHTAADEAEAADTSDCTFDKANASACVDGMASAECGDYGATPPTACGEVWTCGDTDSD